MKKLIYSLLWLLPLSSMAHSLLLSEYSNRTQAVTLDGLILDPEKESHIFVEPDGSGNIKKVEFYVNGNLLRSEGLAPYDAGGTANDNSSIAVPQSVFTQNFNQVLAKVHHQDGSIVDLQANVKVPMPLPEVLVPNFTSTPGDFNETYGGVGTFSGGWKFSENGFVRHKFLVQPSMSYKFNIKASGVASNGVAPKINVWVDQYKIGTLTVNSSTPKDYGFQYTIVGGGDRFLKYEYIHPGVGGELTLESVNIEHRSLPCTLPGGASLPHNQTRVYYQAAEVPEGQTCVSEVRKCTNGLLSGSYTHNSCVVNPEFDDAQLLYSQDFESGTEGLKPSTAAVRVTNNPHNGNYSMRGNLKRNSLDPITGKAGVGHVLDVGTVNFKNVTPNEFYYRFWFRIDDAQWRGSDFSNVGNNQNVSMKVGYLDKALPDRSTTQGAFYPVFVGGSTGEMKFADNQNDGSTSPESWSGWKNLPWGWRNSGNNPASTWYGRTGQPFGSDGKWHLFEMHIEYNATPDHHWARMFIDGNVVYDTKNAPLSRGGRFALPKQFHVERFSVFYSNPVQCDLGTDRTEYACGIQVDDIEVWNKMPKKYLK